MAARSRGNGTNFDWLRKSCDISTCDLSPDGNPEKYGRPVKSVIWASTWKTLTVLLAKTRRRPVCAFAQSAKDLCLVW